MPAPVQDKMLVGVMTEGIVVIGDIILPGLQTQSVKYTFRLVELLNNPRLSMPVYGVIMECLVVENAMIIPEAGRKSYREDKIYLRRDKIICAYQYGEEKDRKNAEYESRSTEKHLAPRKERVMVFMQNGLRIEGDYLKGVGGLAGKQAGQFFAVSNARLGHEQFDDPTLATSFIAVNNDAVVAFWSLIKPQVAINEVSG